MLLAIYKADKVMYNNTMFGRVGFDALSDSRTGSCHYTKRVLLLRYQCCIPLPLKSEAFTYPSLSWQNIIEGCVFLCQNSS